MFYLFPPHIYGILVLISIYVYRWERTVDLFVFFLWCAMALNSFKETSATLFITERSVRNACNLVTVRPMMTQDINTPQEWVVILIVCLHMQFHFSLSLKTTRSISTVTMLNHFHTTNIHNSTSYYHDSYIRASCVRYRQINKEKLKMKNRTCPLWIINP